MRVTLRGRDWTLTRDSNGNDRYEFRPGVDRPFGSSLGVSCRFYYVFKADVPHFNWIYNAMIDNIWSLWKDSAFGYLLFTRWGYEGFLAMYIGRWRTLGECSACWKRHLRDSYPDRRLEKEIRFVLGSSAGSSLYMGNVYHDRKYVRMGVAWIPAHYLDLRRWSWMCMLPDLNYLRLETERADFPMLQVGDPLLAVVSPVMKKLVSRDYREAEVIKYIPDKVWL